MHYLNCQRSNCPFAQEENVTTPNKNNNNQDNGMLRQFAVWLIIGMLVFALFDVFQGQNTKQMGATVPFSDFIAKVEAGEVTEATLRDQQVIFTTRNSAVPNNSILPFNNDVSER
ncbi:MAG: hypothetical protein EB121_06985, partial [Alphaproteobacteria bacterium]|nr:hypothetical protein [Alphaproteobacteria bacterium]